MIAEMEATLNILEFFKIEKMAVKTNQKPAPERAPHQNKIKIPVFLPKSIAVISVIGGGLEYSRSNTQVMPTSPKQADQEEEEPRRAQRQRTRIKKRWYDMPERSKKSYKGVIMQTREGQKKNKREDERGKNTQELRSCKSRWLLKAHR